MKLRWPAIWLLFVLLVASDGHTVQHEHVQDGTTENFCVTWSEGKGYQIQRLNSSEEGRNAVACAGFRNAVNETGWAFLDIKTSPVFIDTIQAYGAGYIEGFVTKDLIYWFWQNIGKGECERMKDTCHRVKKHMEINTAWASSMISQNRYKDPYWHQVGLFYDQLDGLKAGWRAAAAISGEHLNDLDFLWMNMVGDLLDLEPAYSNSTTMTEKPRLGMCSALIKILPDAKDLFFGHDAWYLYRSLLRILKKYNFGFHEMAAANSSVVIGRTQSFSSYPAMLFSMDDFYLVSSGLAVTETSISNNNHSLWKFVKPVGGLISGVRAMVANRLAKDGQSWTKIYGACNSGTYNNQWMVVDYKLFKPGRKDLKPGLLWILEQMPGVVVANDETAVLQKQSYWPSYNVPYYESIFTLSGQPKMVAKYGDFFSYHGAPRAKIFRRDHHKVVGSVSMVALMRYNNYLHDPLAICNCTPSHNAMNAIAARADLNPQSGSYPFEILGGKALGATDMKCTNSSMFAKLEFLAAAGPTFDDVPAFQWSRSKYSQLPHFGQPDLWKFSPVHLHW